MDSPAARLLSLRAPVLALLIGLLAACPLVAQRAPQSGGAPWKRIPAPQDRSAVKGTWTHGDQSTSITAGDYYDLHVLMTKLDASVRRAVPDRLVWTHIALASEARAYGLLVTDQEVNRSLEAEDEEIYDALVARWRRQGVDPAAARALQREKLLIAKLKDLFLNNQRVGTKQAFDAFKRDRLQYKLAFARFAADDFVAELKTQPLDDLALQKYWTDNNMVRNRFRKRATLSADIIYLDRDRLSMDQAIRLSGGDAVTREQALAYFLANKTELMRSFPADKRHLIEIGENTRLEDIVSPFSVLEETIKKRLLVEGVLDRAYAEVKANGTSADLAKIAEKYELGSLSVVDLGQAGAATQLRAFGFNAWTTMNQMPANSVSPSIMSERNRSWFCLLRAKTPTRLPKFEEVKDEVRKTYYERTAYNKARDRARLAKSKLDQIVADAIASDKQRLESEAQAEAEGRILERGLSKPAEINREKMKANARARQAVEKLRAAALPKHFDAWVKNEGLTLSETPYFEFNQTRVNRNTIEDEAERRLSFFKTNFYVRNLNIGQVTSILLDDPVTSTLYVAKLVDKKDPALNTMSAVDLMQSRMRETTLAESRFAQRWQFNAIQRRLSLQISK